MKKIDARLTYAIDLGCQRTKAEFEKMPSAIGTKYEHRVHGVCEIKDHRAIYDRGDKLPAPYIEVQLVGADVSFWTGACYLHTMELVKDA